MKTATGLLAAALLLATPAIADTHPAARCIYSNEIEGWKAPDAKTIYLRVQGKRTYRLDLSAPCPALRRIGAFLVTKLRGSTSLCAPIDWDLHVMSSWDDIPSACIVKTMTALTPEEAAALPAGAKP